MSSVDNTLQLYIERREKAQEATNLSQYWIALMETEPSLGLDDFPVASVCGLACVEIINKAHDLLVICDPHHNVVYNIKEGVKVAVDIICFG